MDKSYSMFSMASRIFVSLCQIGNSYLHHIIISDALKHNERVERSGQEFERLRGSRVVSHFDNDVIALESGVIV